MYISVGQAAEVIGVSISTLRRWEDEESFKPDFRTKGGHRRYDLSRIEQEFLNKCRIFLFLVFFLYPH